MNKINRLFNKARAYWYGLFYGLKSTNDTVLTQVGIDNSVGTEINQQVAENRVSKDLLRGEVTQQVEELRYRTYKIDREAKKFDYFSPMKAIRFDKQDSKFVKYENSDGLELVTIQPNNAEVKNVSDGVKDIDFMKTELIDKAGNIKADLGDFLVVNDYTIKVERDFMPRFKLEAYTTRLVVKKLDDEDNFILDFYVSMYPKENDMKSIYFVNEVKKIMDGYRQSDITSFERVMFTTLHAYGLEDMIEFRFNHVYFKDILEYDGHYILRFKAHAYVNGKDLTDEFHSESMEHKYETNEKKEVVIDVFNGGNKHETFVCSECGKVVEYDTMAIDNMVLEKPRYADEEGIETDSGVMEYLDLQMAEQTFGKKLCKDCLRKYMNKMDNIDE